MQTSARFLHFIRVAGHVLRLRGISKQEWRLSMKVPELCKTCKYVTVLAHGIRCRKKMRVRYVNGKFVCPKYRMSKRYQTDSIFG